MIEIFIKRVITLASLSLLIPVTALASDNLSKEVIELNNEGVRCLERKEFDQAIFFLKKATQKDPSYQMARSNLAIAINNKGLDVYNKGSTEGSLHLMESSYFNDPTNKTTRYNLEGVIRMLKLNPDSPSDRCGLSGKAALRGDGTAAWVELCAAFEKLNNIFFPPKPTKNQPELALPYNDKSDVFYRKYVSLLDKRIRENWKPPAEQSSYTEKIIVTVKNNGQISMVTADKQGERFAAFKNAVEKSSPAPKLYHADKEKQIEFTFRYNVMR